MSLILKLLGWTGLPTWLLEIIVVAIAMGAVLLYHHHVVGEGIAKQRAADAVALQKLQQEADQKTQALRERAQDAEALYAKERNDGALYRAAHPITGADQLCHSPNSGSPHLPAAGAPHSGNGSSGPAAPVGQPVPGGNPPVAPDRFQLLTAFAALCDQQTAVIREWQQR